jgi:hypothetical protein
MGRDDFRRRMARGRPITAAHEKATGGCIEGLAVLRYHRRATREGVGRAAKVVL